MSTVINNSRGRQASRVASLVSEARRRSPVLFWTSVGHLVLLALMLGAAPFDARTVLGINPWIKPIKFAVSNSIYMLTVGWLLFHLPAAEKVKARVCNLVAATAIAETALITLQAARGTTSHHNVSTLGDAGILGVMGLMIVLNTIVIIYVALKFWRTEPAVPAPYLWGIRLGLTMFILASMEGFVMVGHMSHSVGVADGGPGLPFVNWSTRGGDLRIAHFVGLHALQVLPLAGHVFSRPGFGGSLKARVLGVWGFAIIYAGFALLLFLRALAGAPLISF